MKQWFKNRIPELIVVWCIGCLIGVTFYACTDHRPDARVTGTMEEYQGSGLQVAVFDSCEYIVLSFHNGAFSKGYSITHKGNCRNHGEQP